MGVLSWLSIASARLLVLAVLLLPWAAAGQIPAEPEQYRALVDEALREYSASNYEESRALFLRAHELFPNARTHRGIGMTEFELRNYDACIKQLDWAIRSTVRPLDSVLREDTERLRSRARSFVGRLILDIDPKHASLAIDGLPVTLPPDRELMLTIGDHIIEASEAGFSSARSRIVVKGGEYETVTLVLSRSPPLPERALTRRWYKNPWLWTTVGVVVAGAATGMTLALTQEDSTAGPLDGGSTHVGVTAP